MKYVAWWTLGITAVVVLALGLLPTGDASYTCDSPPVVRLFDPQPESGSSYFFDAGAACNPDARTRGWAALFVLLVGGGTASSMTLVDRRRRLAGCDGAGAEGGHAVRSIW